MTTRLEEWAKRVAESAHTSFSIHSFRHTAIKSVARVLEREVRAFVNEFGDIFDEAQAVRQWLDATPSPQAREGEDSGRKRGDGGIGAQREMEPGRRCVRLHGHGMDERQHEYDDRSQACWDIGHFRGWRCTYVEAPARAAPSTTRTTTMDLQKRLATLLSSLPNFPPPHDPTVGSQRAPAAWAGKPALSPRQCDNCTGDAVVFGAPGGRRYCASCFSLPKP